MPKRASVDFEELAKDLSIYLMSGVSSSVDVCKNLRISQSTFSRLITRRSGDFLVVGRGKKTRYALKRSIPNVGGNIVIYEINEQGKASGLGKLQPIHPSGFHFESSRNQAIPSQFFDAIPFFLDDLRPSGFLGRLLPRRHPNLGLPKDVVSWTVNDCFSYLTRFGSDLIGNLILGDEAFQMYLRRNQGDPEYVSLEERDSKYPKRATEVLELGDPGSSAGGEQPKFSAVVGPELTSVLVKFSPRVENPVGQRRADLIICEHIALETIRRHGYPAAKSNLIFGDNRVFLEVERFDRVGRLGRKGLVSLRALDAAFVGNGENWGATSEKLLAQKLIDKEMDDRIRWLEMFGHLIANSDMHLANISFYFQAPDVLGLTPTYDMLPMLYAPQNDQIVGRVFEPPVPKPNDAGMWRDVWKAARDFWSSASSDDRISSEFQATAEGNLKKILALEDLQQLLP